MKLKGRAVLAGGLALMAVLAGQNAAQAAAQQGEYTASCSDGEGHKGYINYTTWNGYSPETNMLYMRFALAKASGGGNFRIETYRWAVAADGHKTPKVGIAPDQDRAANNAYASAKSISQTLGNMTYLYRPSARNQENKWGVYQFVFLFRNASGGFTSDCSLTIKRSS